MPYVRIWLHCVWGTKNRYPYLTPEIKQQVIDHIRENAREKEIYLNAINGHTDHLHCIVSLRADQSLAKVIQLIKGESSFWINKNGITPVRFEWADEYFAVSVSDSDIQRVRNYIWRQEEHHRKESWEDEYREFIREYGFEEFRG